MFRVLSVILSLWAAVPAVAQDFSALAKLEPARSYVRDASQGIEMLLQLSQPVPYRLFTLDDPKRLIMDFREVDFSGAVAQDIRKGDNSAALRFGVFRPGWSRLVLDLNGAYEITEAGMRTDAQTGRAAITVRMAKTEDTVFAAQSGMPPTEGWQEPKAAEIPAEIRRQDGSRPLRVVLDPGHGGIDPGAERDNAKESDLMLLFARELQENLIRAGGYEVTLTRTEDVFVPLETRVSVARHARADVFISLHADALAEGRATGTTLYTLSDAASDKASALLAERHDRDDLLAGVDLSQQDDIIATVLMELVRRDTTPRSEKLAQSLLAGFQDEDIQLYKKPKLSAGFSVLKAPDIPSVLIELGFLSNPADLRNLQNPEWRKRATDAIKLGLREWAANDAAEAKLIRQ